MDAATLKFIVFTVFNAATLVAGYVAYHRGWLSLAFSRKLHLFTVVVAWGLMNFMCVWSVPLSPTLVWIALFPTVLIVVGVVAGGLIGRAMGLRRMSLGVTMVSAGTSNTGFTLGAYLAYCLLGDGQGAGPAALAMGVTMVTIMQVSAIPVLYPLAAHFAAGEGRPSVGKLIRQSFWDLRAMPLYAGTTGLTLNVLGVTAWPAVAAPPGLLAMWWVTVLIYVGSFGAHFGIGMNVRPLEALRPWREHATLALAKFAVFPLATAAMLWLTRWTALPAEGLTRDLLFIEGFMATGLMSVMISNMFHLDARLSASLWVVNTALFVMVPLPILIWLY
jgi:hypothetical protein